jgi:phosphatidylcholine synthase
MNPRAAGAWLVHAFTASGAVLAFLALLAVERQDWVMALVWLLIALVVDGVDGSFARWAQVKELAPRVDGDVMDLVIDYLNYVFVPALLILRAELVPEALAIPLVSLILISALYCFARSDMKSDDNYFRGFPALWNVVAFYLLVMEADPVVGAVVVIVLAVLTFAPVHFIHPFRVREYGSLPPILAFLWLASTGALLWTRWGDGARFALVSCSIATAAILVGLGLLRTARGWRGRSRKNL